MVVDSKKAYYKSKEGKFRLKVGVYGMIDKDTTYVYKNVEKRKGEIKRKFVIDLHKLKKGTKEDDMGFFDSNSNKRKAYLIDIK